MSERELPPSSTWRAVANAELGRLQDELDRVGNPTNVRARREHEIARGALERARQVSSSSYGSDWLKLFYSGAYIEETWTRLHEANRAVLMLVDDDGARARIPFVRAAVLEHVGGSDPQREGMLAFLDEVEQRETPMSSAERERLREIRAYADERSDLFQREIRSFRNYVLIFGLALGVVLVAAAAVGAIQSSFLSLCADPDASLGSNLCPRGGPSPHRIDVAMVELIGGLGGLVAALVRVRSARRLPSPYGLVVAQSLLKIGTGAALALIGVLMLQGGVLVGLSRQPGSHILAYAALFGLAQQALTRLVDDRVGELAGAGTPRRRQADPQK